MYDVEFASRLSRAMHAREMNGAELARAVGISRFEVSRYTNAHKLPSLPTLIKIADALGVTSDYLLGLPKEKIEDEANEVYNLIVAP